jgi:hypothetical protein
VVCCGVLRDGIRGVEERRGIGRIVWCGVVGMCLLISPLRRLMLCVVVRVVGACCVVGRGEKRGG